jgi:hypothetical protein
MSQARKTAIIELKMIGAIGQTGVWDLCTPAFKYLEEHILENSGRRKHKVSQGFNKQSE